MEFDPNIAKRKEAIFSRCPLLKAVLNHEPKDNVTKIRAAVRNEIGEKYGRGWNKLTLIPLIYSAVSMNVFSTTLKKSENIVDATSLIVEIGYEIGDAKDARFFMRDIVDILVDKDAIDVFHSIENVQNLWSMVKAIVYTGCHLRKWDLGIKKNVIEEMPGPFADFIDDLNLSDL